MADESFADWIEDAAWDMVQLGGQFLPGICTVESLEVGLDIDVQKKRKKEKAKLRDNGLSPCAFQIIVELTAAEWPQWVAVLPGIKPKTGGIRKPLSIVHPLVNLNDIRDVYVHKIHYDAPTARRGMKISIRIAEWFEEEQDAKPSKKVETKPPRNPKIAIQAPQRKANIYDKIRDKARRIREEAILRNLPKVPLPGQPANIAGNTFEDP